MSVGLLRNYRREEYFWWAFLLCAAASLVPIWSVKYLPMVDLPQHAAQVSILRNYNDPAFGFSEHFRLHLITPYAFAYYLAYLFAHLFSVAISMKIVVSMAVVSLPLALYVLLRKTQGDPWWSLIGFSAGFGYNFLWGLFNFMVALPLGVICITQGLEFAMRPSLRNGVFLGMWMMAVFMCHGIVFAMCATINGLIILWFAPRFRLVFAHFATLAIPCFVAFLWYLDPGNRMPQIGSHLIWNLSAFERVPEFFGALLSFQGDDLATRLSFLLLGAVLVGSRLSFIRKSYLLIFVCVVSIFMASPYFAFGHSLIYPRLASFVFITGLMVFTKTENTVRRVICHGILIGVTIVWMAVLSVRFHGFNLEARGFDEVMKNVEPNRRLLGMIFDRGSAFVPNTPFDHFEGWYQTEKGGLLDFSFGGLYNAVAQYKPGRAPLPTNLVPVILKGRSEKYWEKFREFDYYFVRSASALPEGLKEYEHNGFVLAARKGDWWLFRKRKGYL